VESRGVALPMPEYGLAAGEPSRLLRLAQSGDPEAFATLLRTHEALVAGTALRLLGSRQDAQDAAQEVFLKLHRRLWQIEDTGNLPGWLYRVTVNVCRDIRRKRPSAGPLDETRLASSGSADADLVREGQLRLIEDALRRLPEKERAALTLRDLEGLSTREVAGILGTSEATVRSQVSQARLKIRKMLRGQA
jgi:RNA polymerase sigma-70 factor (ECF subfamily)